MSDKNKRQKADKKIPVRVPEGISDSDVEILSRILGHYVYARTTWGLSVEEARADVVRINRKSLQMLTSMAPAVLAEDPSASAYAQNEVPHRGEGMVNRALEVFIDLYEKQGVPQTRARRRAVEQVAAELAASDFQRKGEN